MKLYYSSSALAFCFTNINMCFNISRFWYHCYLTIRIMRTGLLLFLKTYYVMYINWRIMFMLSLAKSKVEHYYLYQLVLRRQRWLKIIMQGLFNYGAFFMPLTSAITHLMKPQSVLPSLYSSLIHLFILTTPYSPFMMLDYFSFPPWILLLKCSLWTVFFI